MDRSFLKFVWRHSKRQQILILVITVVSFPFVYISLEIPKIIINEAIDGTDFPKEMLGFELEQIPYLLALCCGFLMLVVVINALKWVLNVTIGMCGERMLRRLRFMLFERVMRFPMSRFRTTKPGEVIQSLLGEIDPLGGFIGEVVATPAFQGGLLVVYAVFIFVQDLWLGLAAVALYPIQAWLIPKLQRRVIELNKERAQNTRGLADAISESVGNITDIHTNDTARWHMAQIAGRLHTNTLIRMALFRRKFTIKFINNFLNQLTPFFFYSIGGYLVIRGRLDFGALVAVLAAYKDLAAPWKAVLAYIQRYADFYGRYGFVVETFVGDDVLGPERVYPPADGVRRLEGPLRMRGVEGGPGTGGLSVDDLEISPGETVAVEGGEGGAREAFLRMAAGLVLPVSGQVAIGETRLGDATLPEIGASLAFVGAEPGMVNRSMRDNLIYGLLRQAPDLAGQSGEAAELLLTEARRTGNITADPEGDWVDYEAAGVTGPDALRERLAAVADETGLSAYLLTIALDTRLPPEATEEWTPRIAEARLAFGAGWPESERSDLLEAWDRARFNENASLLENLLFALPVSAESEIGAFARLPAVRKLIGGIGAEPLLETIGREIAREFAELVEAVGESSPVLDGFGAYTRPTILAAAELAAAVNPSPEKTSDEHRDRLIGLAAIYVHQRDGLDVLDTERIDKVLACRERASSALEGRDDFVAFDEARVNPAETVAENIVNAKRRYNRRSAWKELDRKLEAAIASAGLREDLIRLGLDAPVGAGGSALSSAARRRVGLARALIKMPGLVVLDGPAGSGSEEDRRLRAAIRECLPDAILLFAATDPAASKSAGRCIRIDSDGTLVISSRHGAEDG